MRAAVVIALTVLTALASPCQAQSYPAGVGAPYNVARWVEETLFEREDIIPINTSGAPKGQQVRRWNDKLRVSFSADPRAKAVATDVLNQLSEITGLGWDWSEGFFSSPNVKIEFMTTTEIKRKMGIGANCAGLLWTDTETKSIVRAEVYIASDRENLPAWLRGASAESFIRSCLAEELAQSLGAPNDSCTVQDSLFCHYNEANRWHDRVELTKWDKLALRILYSPRLRPGMAREQARPIIREMVEENYARLTSQ